MDVILLELLIPMKLKAGLNFHLKENYRDKKNDHVYISSVPMNMFRGEKDPNCWMIYKRSMM
jgi:hypothetical protein